MIFWKIFASAALGLVTLWAVVPVPFRQRVKDLELQLQNLQDGKDLDHQRIGMLEAKVANLEAASHRH